MADGYRFSQQTTANYFYPQSTQQPQHPRHQIIRNSTPPTGRAPFDAPSPARTPDPHSPHTMYNQHQQGQRGHLNGAGRGMQQQMGLYSGYQQPNTHQQHAQQHHGAIPQDHNTHPPNGSSMGHHPTNFSQILQNTTPNFTPSGLQNGHTAVRAQTNHNAHWLEQLKLHDMAHDANTTMINNNTPHYYARIRSNEARPGPGATAPHPAVASVLATYQAPDADDSAGEQTRISNYADVTASMRQDWHNMDMSGLGLRVIKDVFRYDFLTELFISSNKLTYIPAEIGQLRSLMFFDASYNQIREVPPALGMCVMLKSLLLFNNSIETLPSEVGYLYQLEMLGIEGNPLQADIKSEIMDRGTKSLITRLRENAPKPSAPPERADVDLLGGASLAPGTEQLKVLSYNILCDWATRTQYDYTPSAALSWDYRKENILAEIIAQDADIVCLQEVDVENYHNFFAPKLAMRNMRGVFWPKARSKTMTLENAAVVDGCATFYRNDRWLLLDKHLVEFGNYSANKMNMQGPSAADIYNRIMPRDQMAVLTFLENRRTGSRLIVGNGHLFWDPEFPDVKLVQTGILLHCLSALGEKYARWPPTSDKQKREFKFADDDVEPLDSEPLPDPPLPSMSYVDRINIPLVLCVDLNSTADSSPFELLSKGTIGPDHKDLQGFKYGLFTEKGIQHPYQLRSAYSVLDGTPNELQFTNYTPGFTGVIDHIFYSVNTLEAHKLRGGVDPEYMKMVPGFPNYHFPSDHLSLTASFSIKSPRKEIKSLPEPDFGQGSNNGSRRGRSDRD